jgi:hypothetical protein
MDPSPRVALRSTHGYSNVTATRSERLNPRLRSTPGYSIYAATRRFVGLCAFPSLYLALLPPLPQSGKIWIAGGGAQRNPRL